jgi:hypothetical protein
MFISKRQSFDHLHVFGARCWAKVPTVHGVQVTGGSKLNPRSVECRLLGYASGSGNYRVQDIASRRVFVSQDVVFEEGRPHRTLASGGEETSIPVFDMLEALPLDHAQAPDPAITDGTTQRVDPDVGQPNQTFIPAIPEAPCRSAQAPHPSMAGAHSLEYQNREAMSKDEGHDWATDQNIPKAI